MKKIGIGLLVLLLVSIGGAAQETDDVISAEVLSSVDKFQPGNEYAVAIKILIAAPYHINSDQPTEDFMVPTTISFNTEGGLEFSEPEFPTPLIKSLSLSEMPMQVYEESAVVVARLMVPDDFNGTEILIAGSIEYQA